MTKWYKITYTLGCVLCIGAVIFWIQPNVAAQTENHAPLHRVINAKDTSERGYPVKKTEDEWKKQLTPEQYQITRKKGTERAFSGQFWNEKATGDYHCICCGELLFSSETKFDSGTGWPSFWRPAKESIEFKKDRSFFMRRTEVLCNNCGAHLGHLFDDGPEPTGKRYCINSASLDFKPSEKETE